MYRRKRKPPMLFAGGFTQNVYICTSYTERPIKSDDGRSLFIANTKFDVTEQFEAIALELGWKRPRKKAKND